mgnify:CR=1 FL=1
MPADSLELSPADAVFVRMGARDRIMLGQSTFFVELSETSAALHRCGGCCPVGAWQRSSATQPPPPLAHLPRRARQCLSLLWCLKCFLSLSAPPSRHLSRATPASLVILDELGRGTSTGDGAAIAAAVLDHFTASVGCRGMFATHYHHISGGHAFTVSPFTAAAPLPCVA